MTFLTKKYMVTFLGFYPAAIFVQLERLFDSENCEILFCLSNKAVCEVSEKNSENKNFLYCSEFNSEIRKFYSLYRVRKFRML